MTIDRIRKNVNIFNAVFTEIGLVMNRAEAEQLLKTSLALPQAEFREGQWEAIDALVNDRQKVLVVQRTGWGKSSVYFISAKIFRV